MDCMGYGWVALHRVATSTVNEHFTIRATLRCLAKVQSGWFRLGVVWVKLVVDGLAQLASSRRCRACLGFRTVWDARDGRKA